MIKLIIKGKVSIWVYLHQIILKIQYFGISKTALNLRLNNHRKDSKDNFSVHKYLNSRLQFPTYMMKKIAKPTTTYKLRLMQKKLKKFFDSEGQNNSSRRLEQFLQTVLMKNLTAIEMLNSITVLFCLHCCIIKCLIDS